MNSLKSQALRKAMEDARAACQLAYANYERVLERASGTELKSDEMLALLHEGRAYAQALTPSATFDMICCTSGSDCCE